MATAGSGSADRSDVLPPTNRLVRSAAALVGAFHALAGVWAMVDPAGFFDAAATFPPYNQHLIQDIGAFMIGVGAVLLLAAVLQRSDGLVVALWGGAVGAAAHTVSHAVGHDLGGTPGVDIPTWAVITVVLAAAGVGRWRELRRPPA